MKFFDNLRVLYKLLILAGGGVLGVIIVAYFGYTISRSEIETVNRLDNVMQIVKNMDYADMMHDAVSSDIYKAFHAIRNNRSKLPEIQKEFDEHYTLFNESLRYVKNNITDPKLSEEVAAAEKKVQEYLEGGKSVIKNTDADSATIAGKMQEFDKLYAELEGQLGTLGDHIAEYPKQELIAITAKSDRNTLTVISVVAITLLMGIAFSILITRSFTVPFDKLKSISNDFAAGNYHTNFAIDRTDELGDLLGTLKNMIGIVIHQNNLTDEVISAVYEMNMAYDTRTAAKILLEGSKRATSAQYSAVALVNDKGVLVDFLHSGFNELQIQAIGRMPEGKGLLGFSMSQKKPIRVDNIAKHSNSSGFPPNHPPMTTFMSAPISNGKNYYGHVYLTNKENDEPFNDIDELEVVLLAKLLSIRLDEQSTQTSLRQLLNRVQNLVNTVSSATNQVAVTLETLSNGAQSQSEQVINVAAAVEEMSATIMENAQSASQSASVASENGTIAIQGATVVGNTVAQMKQIAEVVNQATVGVNALGISSTQIGEIVSVIRDIADQTNLLALNASIEAARAGEHGRSFAVVADEVRKLAERTGTATREISAMIKSIQNETRDIIAMMQTSNGAVNEGIATADSAISSINSIVTTAQRGADLATQIAAANEELSATSEDVSRNVTEISDITTSSARSISEISTTILDIQRMTNQLFEFMQEFEHTFHVQEEAKKEGYEKPQLQRKTISTRRSGT